MPKSSKDDCISFLQILANQAMVCSKLNSPDVDYYMEEAFQMADSEQEKELHAIKNAIQVDINPIAKTPWMRVRAIK